MTKNKTLARTYDPAEMDPRRLANLRSEIDRVRASARELASEIQCGNLELDLDAIEQRAAGLQLLLAKIELLCRTLKGSPQPLKRTA